MSRSKGDKVKPCESMHYTFILFVKLLNRTSLYDCSCGKAVTQFLDPSQTSSLQALKRLLNYS